MNAVIQEILASLHRRRLAGGGFEEHAGGGYRPDATAWAALTLSAANIEHEFIDPARLSLAQHQLPDGRLPISPEHPKACWPTPLAVLAWSRVRQYDRARERAVSFLLDFTGVHWERTAGAPLAHDTALKGWPWIADTHSWVEPTALTVMALRSAGRGSHPRVAEAIEMLLDRQLPNGGWNYGNTIVYDQELRPMPDSTGLALMALSGRTHEEDVFKSIHYLSSILPEIKSPFSLSWGLLGLSAWGHTKEQAENLISRCLDRRSIYGDFTTTHLCLLLLAHPALAGSLHLSPKEDA